MSQLKIPLGGLRHLTFGVGTIGLTTARFYADIFLKPYFGLYVSDGIFRRRYKITWRGLQLLKVEIIDRYQATRILRRTMKPGALLTLPSGHIVEAMSYPSISIHGGVTIYCRTDPGNPSSAVHLSCERLRPIQFSPRITGVPANDPHDGK